MHSLLDAPTAFSTRLDRQRTELEYLATEHVQIAMLLYPGERAGEVLRRLSLSELAAEVVTRTVEAQVRAESLQRMTAQRKQALLEKSNKEAAALAQMMKQARVAF